MLWQKDKRAIDGGYWECREKRREYNRRASERKKAWARAHPKNRYVYTRRWALARQRARIQERLSQLSEEAKSLGVES